MNISNLKMGDWNIIEPYEIIVKYEGCTVIHYLCQCKCGLIRLIGKSSFKYKSKNGNPKCCKNCDGKNKKGISLNIKHGHSPRSGVSKEYRCWYQMRTRCSNANTPGFHNYGGRGIRVCDRWNKFENFFEDMGSSPPGYQIDRIDPDGNYEFSNCRWVSRIENLNNRRVSSKYAGLYSYIHRDKLCSDCLPKTDK